MTQSPPQPDHWHLKFGGPEMGKFDGTDFIIDDAYDAASAYLDLCENIFADTDIDREDAEAKINFFMAMKPYTIIHMGYGAWSTLCVPCAGCKKWSLN